MSRCSLGFCLIGDFFISFPACTIYKCHSVPRMCCTGGVSSMRVVGPAPACLPRLLLPILTHQGCWKKGVPAQPQRPRATQICVTLGTPVTASFSARLTASPMVPVTVTGLPYLPCSNPGPRPSSSLTQPPPGPAGRPRTRPGCVSLITLADPRTRVAPLSPPVTLESVLHSRLQHKGWYELLHLQESHHPKGHLRVLWS